VLIYYGGLYIGGINLLGALKASLHNWFVLMNMTYCSLYIKVGVYM